MTDLISRQAAIKALCENGMCATINCNAIHCEDKEAIEQVPAIDPVKHGKWIADKYTRKCSECESTYWMREGNEWNYCPNCGAKNGGEG